MANNTATTEAPSLDEYVVDILDIEEEIQPCDDPCSPHFIPTIIKTHTKSEIERMSPEEVVALIKSEVMCPKTDIDLYADEGYVVMLFNTHVLYETRKDLNKGENLKKGTIRVSNEVVFSSDYWADYAIEMVFKRDVLTICE